MTTHHVLIALGSNDNQQANISWAVDRLALLLTEMRQTAALWSAGYNNSSLRYLNKLVDGNTTLTETAFNEHLKELERLCGRKPGQAVTLDLDLMSYDGQRRHEADWQRAYFINLTKLPFE